MQAKELVFSVKQQTQALRLTADDVGICFRDGSASILQVYEWIKRLSFSSSREPGIEEAIVTLSFIPGHEPSHIFLIAEAAVMLSHYVRTKRPNHTEPAADTTSYTAS
jgi:hypothetical protein